MFYNCLRDNKYQYSLQNILYQPEKKEYKDYFYAFKD